MMQTHFTRAAALIAACVCLTAGLVWGDNSGRRTHSEASTGRDTVSLNADRVWVHLDNRGSLDYYRLETDLKSITKKFIILHTSLSAN
jgi:hypothetical protein